MLKPALNLRNVSMALLLIATLWQWGQAGIITGKAYLAKWLIAEAWQQTLITGENTKPWPWADTWPVAKISFKNNKTFYVLAGGVGNSLAFGPGHLSNTALPGTSGASVIGGHRDTHFSILKNADENDTITVQNKEGNIANYTIDKSWVANSLTQALTIDQNKNSLYLVTCYPFNGITAGGNKRFVVKADIADTITLSH